jgi:UDP-glucose:glycoprotein glucosyltransferase
VSYKWPWWLQPQYEKLTILFLDLLFPLEPERVVCIDSDQIVRTELIELMLMDFNAAAYAFTSLCESRKATDPFRFWKHGFWKRPLGDKLCHILALFAIDLPKFRQFAVGDWLGVWYQQFSSDPESLSNRLNFISQFCPSNKNGSGVRHGVMTSQWHVERYRFVE